jgi:hypothetical protein
VITMKCPKCGGPTAYRRNIAGAMRFMCVVWGCGWEEQVIASAKELYDNSDGRKAAREFQEGLQRIRRSQQHDLREPRRLYG